MSGDLCTQASWFCYKNNTKTLQRTSAIPLLLLGSSVSRSTTSLSFFMSTTQTHLPANPSPNQGHALASPHPLTAKPIKASLERLQQSGTYLADPNFREKVEWVREGSSHKLVVKSAQSGDSPEDEVAPEMAILSLIVQISPGDFYMSSDGNYRGSGKFNTPFLDVKLTCHGGKPVIEELATDFDTTIANLYWLQDQASTRGFTAKKGLLVENIDGIFVKIRHKLFEARTILYLYYTLLTR